MWPFQPGLTHEMKIQCYFCFIDRLEGDIRLSRNIEALVVAGVPKKENPGEPVTRGAVSDKIYLWANGRVPYIIHSDFGEHEEFSRTQTGDCKCITRGWGIQLYGLYRYVRPQRVWFLSRFAYKWAILVSIGEWFLHFSLELYDINFLKKPLFSSLPAINKSS